MTNDLLTSLNAIQPLIFLAVWASLMLLVDAFLGKQRPGLTPALAAVGLAVTLVMTIMQFGQTYSGFSRMITLDSFALYLNVLLLVSGLAGVALSYDYLRRTGIKYGEYYILMLYSLIGMMLMGMSSDLIMTFLALELLSIPLYVLAGIAVPRACSEEASIKYFLLGSFASSFFVYGTALIYGATGSTNLAAVLAAQQVGLQSPALLLVGAALMLIGLGFKVAIVPFHMWTPDVYEGSPTSVTAFMSVGAKVAGFAALLRIFVSALPALAADLTPILWALAALTMILGNVVAIAQQNIKRLLAYSSIAHAGYVLMALVPYGEPNVAANSVASALFYLVAYGLTSFAAWSVVIAVEQPDGEGLGLENLAGLGRKHPGLAMVMLVAMLSFTGIPPTLGFMGKFFLFRTVIEGGFYWLALIGVLTSLVSAYYYLRVVVIMFMQEGQPVLRPDGWLLTTAYLSAAAVVLLMIFAQPLLNLASQALLQLF